MRIVAPDIAFPLETAHEFLSRTKDALDFLARSAPEAYRGVRANIRGVILSRHIESAGYHEFLRAAIVPPHIGLESDPACYAAWLVRISAEARNDIHSTSRVEGFLHALGSEDRERVSKWLASHGARERQNWKEGGRNA